MLKTCKIVKSLIWLFLLNSSTCIGLEDDTFEYTLENGLKLIVKEDHRSPVVINQIWYKVGSSYEPNGITGISHALEHMVFKGTNEYPAGEFEKIVESKGGQHNAFTSRDYTVYYQKAQAKELSTLFKLEADRMRNVLLKEEDFAKEQKVIIEERLLRTDDKPTKLAEEQFYAAAFPANSYRQPVIGWMDDIKALKTYQLQEWYDRWYRPNNAILVVVGDVKAEQVYDLAVQNFAKIEPSGVFDVNARKVANVLGNRKVIVNLPTQYPQLFLGYNLPSLQTAENKEEVYALSVLAAILSHGESSRFMNNLIRKKQIAAQAYGWYMPHQLHATLFEVRAIPMADSNLEQLEEQVLSEINDLKENLVKDKELDRVKVQIIAENIYEKDSIFHQALQLGSLEASGYSWQEDNNYLQQLQKVTAKQIQEVAKKYLTVDNLVTTYLEPVIGD